LRCCPKSVVRQYEGFSIRSHAISPQIGNVNTMVVWRKNREISPVINCFISFMTGEQARSA
jgi:hypothetical protein